MDDQYSELDRVERMIDSMTLALEAFAQVDKYTTNELLSAVCTLTLRTSHASVKQCAALRPVIKSALQTMLLALTDTKVH